MGDILDFLYFGFLTNENYSTPILNNHILSLLQQKVKRDYYDEESVIKEGVKVLKSSYSHIDDKLLIVPLSGGIDSRTVLAGLIDAGYKRTNNYR